MGGILIRSQAHKIRVIMAKCKPINLPFLGDLHISVTVKDLSNMGGGGNCSYK